MPSLFIGIDPGPTTCGLVVYAVAEGAPLGEVVLSEGKADSARVRAVIAELAADCPTVVIEHTHPGPPSWSVIHTTVMLGRYWEYAHGLGLQVCPVHRREVKATWGRSDSAIRRSLIELHGIDPNTHHYRQAGPLRGVSSHAWQALAAVLTHHKERTT